MVTQAKHYDLKRKSIPGYYITRGLRKDAIFKLVPKKVYEERARAHRTERTITEILCGDPMFGRSALDREAAKRAESMESAMNVQKTSKVPELSD